ncbi:hypothetical protein NN561_012417 [Cricetulus griseus]
MKAVNKGRGPSASDQASVYTTLEWQEMLEAAEALLALKNSSQTRHQPCGMPGNLPGACGATVAHSVHTYQLYSSDFESSNDDCFVMGSLPACDYTLLVSSNICLQGRGNANLAPGNSTQISDASNQGREICTQLPDASNQGREICTQINDASNQGPEVYTQIPAISNQRAVSAEVDRQKVLDAAEALLILHNSPQAWEETRSIPGSWLLE